jgi:hypothetical protein
MNKLFIIIPVFVLFGSCKKFTEIPPPDSQLTTSVVFSNDATATAAMAGIYGQMLANSNVIGGSATDLSFYAGLSADELTAYSSDATLQQLYNSTVSVSTANIGTYYWTKSYNLIYQANAMIEQLAVSTTVTDAVKKQLSGEAKFVRALYHFYLVNLFGDVPVVTSTDYRINNIAVRTPKAQVYDQIIADLKDAQGSLAAGYVTGVNVATTERTRPNSFAATALLARAYLYANKYDLAEAQATAVINNSAQYSIVSNFANVFLKNSAEAIFQLQGVGTSNTNTYAGARFIFSTTPNLVALTPALVNSFEPGDARKTNWVGSLTVGANTYYYPYKYKIVSNATISEYSMVLRLAEQYLIRAEARVQNNLPGAIGDLNVLRARASLPALSTTLSPAQVTTAIEHERQVELFTEFGHRWLDLKRTGRADAVLGQLKGANWQPTDVLYPLPLTEIQTNQNLTQNPGY